MVWPITGAKCYVRKTGMSMKVKELIVLKEFGDNWARVQSGVPVPSLPEAKC
jgi:hypothetical protein